MRRILITLRGFLQNPTIVELDLDDLRIVREVKIDCGLSDQVPRIKRGFTEFQYHGSYLIAATWDRVCFLDPETLRVEEVISDQRFSDLHGLYIDDEGVIWLANTNLDGIYTIRNGHVEPFWHAWEPNVKLSTKINDGEDYRFLSKENSPFHSLHVNGVFANNQYVFVTYLGKDVRLNSLQKRFVQLGLMRKLEKKGGLLVLDRHSRRVVKRFSSIEGLHTTISDGNGKLYFTEYFGNALIVLDRENLSLQRSPLQVPPFREWGFLTRGLLIDDFQYWIGHTARRGWREDNPTSLVRSYRMDGSWTGNEIRIPGFAGVYALIEKTV